MPRVLLLLLNAIAFGFLIFSLLRIVQREQAGSGKTIKVIAGAILIILPAAVLAGFIRPTSVYLLIYPLAIAVFVFLSRLRD